MRYQPVIIADCRRESTDALLLTLDGAPVLSDNFRSGQHLNLQADINGEKVYRPYSICQPAARRQLQIGVRLVTGGVMSGYLAKCKTGDTLLAAAPTGAFYLHPQNTAPPTDEDNVLFIAGGSGITPVVAMIEDLLQSQPHSRATLLYANRALYSTMFLERLMQIKNRFMARLEIHFFFTREQPAVDWCAARLNADTLADLTRRGILQRGAYSACYLCGPSEMMTSCEAFLRDDIPVLYSETFIPANSAKHAAAATTPATAAAPRVATIHITMDGAQREFDFCADDTSVLAAAKRRNIALPFACAGGVCGTCRAKVLSGKADMTRNYALEEDDLKNGFVLSCQAKPIGDTLSLSFDY